MRKKGCVPFILLALAGCGGSAGGGGGGTPASEPPSPTMSDPSADGLTLVSATNPFSAGCDNASSSGTSYGNAEVEPSVAVNPGDPMNLFGSWQQDRWSNGGAHGLAGAVSFDGGTTWSQRLAPFSRCSGGNSVNGGDYTRASDPWVSFGPGRHAYWMALSFSDTPNAMLVSRSLDGGDTWGPAQTLILDPDSNAFFNDKNSLTADPNDVSYVYAVWDRFDFASDKGPSMLARSIDGGASWLAAQAIYDPGAHRQTLGNQVVVLADGTVVNLLTELDYATGTSQLKVMRSPDHGANWTRPLAVADVLSVGVSDPDTGADVIDSGPLAQIAQSPGGMLHVVWQDSRFSAGARDGIALISSADGGLTWSSPVQVNGAHASPAFIPTVAVAADGTLGVSYYDLRDNTADTRTLPTDLWLATSSDGLNWNERRISGPFDDDIAPKVRQSMGVFLGDYEGLLGIGTEFRAFFVRTTATLADRTNVYTKALPSRVAAATAAKQGIASYRAQLAPQIVMTPEWRAQVARRVLRERPQLPDKPDMTRRK